MSLYMCPSLQTAQHREWTLTCVIGFGWWWCVAGSSKRYKHESRNTITTENHHTRFGKYLSVLTSLSLSLYTLTCTHTQRLLLFSCSAVSDSLQPHGLQNIRFPFPSQYPGVCSNSCPLNRWCHPTISFSVIPFSSCFQSFPASGPFAMSWLFA